LITYVYVSEVKLCLYLISYAPYRENPESLSTPALNTDACSTIIWTLYYRTKSLWSHIG